MTKAWRRHGPCSYCLEGRLHTHRGRLEWFLTDLREYFQPHQRILEFLADHPTSEYTFAELEERTQLGRTRLNYGLRRLVKEDLLLARVQPGSYPNLVRYQLSTEGAKRYAVPPLPVLHFSGPYVVDDILDEDLGRNDND